MIQTLSAAQAAETVILRVVGQPAPQGSKTAYVRGGRAVLAEGKGAGRAHHAAWRQAVATAARDWQATRQRPLLAGPLQVTVSFLLAKPASKPRWKRYPDVRPDVDKLARSVLDAITGVVIADDAQVCELSASKAYAAGEPPGAEVIVVPLVEARPRARRAAAVSNAGGAP